MTFDNKFFMQSAPGALTVINGEKCLYFGGTSYYELHNHHEVIKAASGSIRKYGINSATSRNGLGTTPLLVDLEKKAADFFGTEDAAYLASGFLSNLAAIDALRKTEKFDAIFVDDFSHYSNRYAARALNKPLFWFHHKDVTDLEKVLKRNLSPRQRPLLMSDGIFPAYGDIAPVPDYLAVLKPYNGILWLDDAHGIGIMGEKGRGTAEFHGSGHSQLYFGGTMSKAFGGFGGIIPGDKNFISEIRSGSVSNGASSPTSAATAASLKGLTIFTGDPGMKHRLHNNASELKNGLKKLGIEVEDHDFPVASWSLKNSAEMKRVQNKLFAKGIAIQYTNYVGAPKEGILRVVVFSTHTSEHIEKLLFELDKLI